MTSHAMQTRSCLAVFHVLGAFVVLAGCRADPESGLQPLNHVCHGNQSYAGAGYAQCGPGSGFHPTVWQSWHESGMAMRCNQGENDMVPGQHGLNAPNGSVLPASGPLPEMISAPEAQKSGKEATPVPPAEPSRTESTSEKATENGPSPLPSPDNKPPAQPGKEPVPAGSKEPVSAGKGPVLPGEDSTPAQEKPPAKLPPSPPVSSDKTMELIIPAPGLAIPSSFYGEAQPTAGRGRERELFEAVPAAFFTHRPVPSASSPADSRADSGNSQNENGCAHFSP